MHVMSQSCRFARSQSAVQYLCYKTMSDRFDGFEVLVLQNYLDYSHSSWIRSEIAEQ